MLLDRAFYSWGDLTGETYVWIDSKNTGRQFEPDPGLVKCHVRDFGRGWVALYHRKVGNFTITNLKALFRHEG